MTEAAVARQCPQCGAQVELPADRIADTCAFCASALVDGTARRETIDRVAPFDIKREVAANLLSEHMQDRWFIPEELRQAGAPSHLQGVLIPFWCYDASARSTWTARQGIYWYRTETYTTTVNGKRVTRTRTVRETEWFDTDGSHVATYVDHLVSGSRGLSEAESNELEPFDLGKALPYSPETLAGWVAEAPTVPRSEAHGTASQELADLENRAIRSFLPADTVSGVDNQTSMEISGLELVMLPVWIGTWRHKDEPLRLLVNAQTGEVVGELPKSWPKIILAALLLLAVVGGMVLFGLLAALLLGQL